MVVACADGNHADVFRQSLNAYGGGAQGGRIAIACGDRGVAQLALLVLPPSPDPSLAVQEQVVEVTGADINHRYI